MPRRGLSSLRALNVGPIVGEYNRDANYHMGQKLGPRDVSLSPNQMRRYPMGSYINANTTSGKALGTYRVADPSYNGPNPTSNTIEFRNRLLGGQNVNISAADNPYGFVQGGIDIFGDYPNPPGSSYQDTGPSLPGQFEQAYRRGTFNTFTDPTTDNAATPPPSSTPAPSLTPYDPMGYGSSDNPPPNDNVSPDLVNTFYGSDNTNDTSGSGGGRSRYPNLSNAPPVTPNGYYDNPGTGPGPGYIGAIDPNIPVARASAVERSGFFGRILRRLQGQPTGNFSYPVPGLGGLPSTFGGGQSWQSNAARSTGGFSPAASGGGTATGGSGYGGGRFAGPSVAFGYGGTQIGSTSGSMFSGQNGYMFEGQAPQFY